MGVFLLDDRFYTIALGLDILGNPFGLIRGIKGGVRDLFYEPYEGAVEGPEEFMSGLRSGVTSLVGKSVGGVLGTGYDQTFTFFPVKNCIKN